MGLRVLLVEDEPDIRAVTRMQLQLQGHQVCGETDRVDDAIALAESEQPDVVLLDLGLADGDDGTAAIQPIAVVAPRSMVVVLSALPAELHEQVVKTRGAFAFVGKTAGSIPRLAQEVDEYYEEFTRALTGETVIAPAARQRPAAPEA